MGKRRFATDVTSFFITEQQEPTADLSQNLGEDNHPNYDRVEYCLWPKQMPNEVMVDNGVSCGLGEALPGIPKRAQSDELQGTSSPKQC